MKILEIITESKTQTASPKPRNFVAKNAMKTTSGAGAHKDKKKAVKQGDVKHKQKQFAEGVAEGSSQQFDMGLAKILKQRGYKGPVKLEQLGMKWVEAIGDIVDIDDLIMVQGTDPEYDGWVSYVSGLVKYAYGAEQGYTTGTAKRVEIDTRDEQGVAEGSGGDDTVQSLVNIRSTVKQIQTGKAQYPQGFASQLEVALYDAINALRDNLDQGAQNTVKELAGLRAIAKQVQTGKATFPQGYTSRLEWVLYDAIKQIENSSQGKPEHVKEDGDGGATAGSTTSAMVGVGAVYKNKRAKKQKPGTNALDMNVNLLTGGSIKR
jgi:hypothetical protein